MKPNGFIAMSGSWAQERSRVANATKKARRAGLRPEDSPAVEDARRDLAAARLEAVVRSIVDAAPPLSQEQRSHLAALFHGDPR